MLHYLHPLHEIFHYEDNKKRQYLHQDGKSPIGKVMGQVIPSYIKTKNHRVPCNV
jgi:hypothetical protein